MTSTLIYLVSILDDVKGFAVAAQLACPVIIMLIIFVGGMLCMEFDHKVVFPYVVCILKYILVAFAIACALHYLLPSSQTATAMYILPKVVKREPVEMTDKEMMKQFHRKVNEWVWEMEDGVKNDK